MGLFSAGLAVLASVLFATEHAPDLNDSAIATAHVLVDSSALAIDSTTEQP